MSTNKFFVSQSMTYSKLFHPIQLFAILQVLQAFSHYHFDYLVLKDLSREPINSSTIHSNFFNLANLTFIIQFEDYFNCIFPFNLHDISYAHLTTV